MTKKVTDNQHPTKEPLLSQQKQLSDFAAFAVENMSDGVYLISKDARIVYVNPAACKQLGYTKEELLSVRIMDIDPHVTEENWGSIRGVTVRDKIQTIETEHRTKDGRLIPVEVVVNYIEIDGEQYSCSFARGITERKQAEETLLKEKAFSDTMINSLPGIFYLFDEDGHFIRWNRNFEIVTGYASKEIEKMNPLDFFSE